MAGYPRVTHPSATNLYFARLQYKSVRLACVKHAASVHPEPGSNSHVKMLLQLSFCIRMLFINGCVRKVFNNDLLSRQFLLAYPNFTVRFVLFTENLLQSWLPWHHGRLYSTLLSAIGMKTINLLIALESSGLHYCLFVKVQY